MNFFSSRLICLPVLLLFCSAAANPLHKKPITEERKFKQLQARIIDGEEAPNGRYPYFVGLFDSFEFGLYCGASLIAPSVVLTAAHCVEDFQNPENVSALIGLYNQSEGSGVEVISVTSVAIHPQYDTFTLEYDLALLKLSADSSIPTIAVADAGCNSIEADADLTVMGFGNLNPSGDPEDDPYAPFESPEILNEVVIHYVPNDQCDAIFTPSNYIDWYLTYAGLTDSYSVQDVYDLYTDEQIEAYWDFADITSDMMCAFSDEGKDSCQGDSGGPLIVKGADSTKDIQVGIVSYGVGCGTVFPGVYSRISDQFSFIEDTLSSAEFITASTSNELARIPINSICSTPVPTPLPSEPAGSPVPTTKPSDSSDFFGENSIILIASGAGVAVVLVAAAAAVFFCQCTKKTDPLEAKTTGGGPVTLETNVLAEKVSI